MSFLKESDEYNKLPLTEKIARCVEILRKVPQKKILIDGPASIGKSTLAKMMNQDLDLPWVSTGDIYRAEVHFLLEKGISGENIDQYSDDELRQELEGFSDEFTDKNGELWVVKPETAEQRLFIKGLRNNQNINQNISALSSRHPLRDVVDNYQRQVVAENDNVFLDGRDMWQVFADQAGLNSVVLVHLDASDEALARRSLYKLGKKDKNITPAELAQAVEKIKARNTGDSAKERGKLLRRREVGAGVGNYDISLDNTNMSAQETYLVLLEELCQKFIS